MQKMNISEAEWTVMQVIWSDHPITANEIVQNLEASTEWKEKTIKTLISRLVKKSLLEYAKKGREYLYSPLVTESSCVKNENKSFLNRVHKGNLRLMLTSFLQEEDLSEEEILELQHILAEKKGGKNS